ncbi:MAG: hypothetical protein HOP11_07305 [Saprospiraceae bacterium]|nr:hypothetical protein [Saprospiraceae bacterium]
MQLLLKFFICILFVYKLNSQSNFNFHCPGNITVNCNIDYKNLDQFGKAYVDQNGLQVWIKDCKVITEINDCGIGEISRIWEVQDPDLNWQSCKQIITLSNANAFGYNDITWPRDITIESCDPESDLKNVSKPFDRPYWKTNKCAKPMLGFSDSRHKVNESCTKLLRTWKILDWCVYDAYKNPNAGIFLYTQTIKLIKNDSAVKILCPNDTVVTTYDCKGVQLSIDPAKFSSQCNIPFIIYNDSEHADTNLSGASGYYPLGDHKFYYIAEYACGKELKCEYNISIKNIKQPTPYCKVGVIIDLMPVDSNGDGMPDEGMVEVWASDLNHGSFHSCPGNNINFSFSEDLLDKNKIFTCKDLGENEVTIYVTDKNGNKDFCKTKIIIQNNTGIPNCKKTFVNNKKYGVNFSVKNFETKSAPQSIKIKLTNTKDNSSFFLQEINQGEFELKDLQCSEDYNIEVIVNDKFVSNVEDILWLKRYLNHKIESPRPTQILAADINSDSKIDNQDLLLISKNRNTNHTNGYKLIPEELLNNNSNSILDAYTNVSWKLNIAEEGIYQKKFTLIPIGRFQSIKNQAGFFVTQETSDNSFIEIRLTQNQNSVSLSHDSKVNLSCAIYDLTGREVRKFQIGENQYVELSGNSLQLSTGFYILDFGIEKKKIFIAAE